jgi:hypothetical protein
MATKRGTMSKLRNNLRKLIKIQSKLTEAALVWFTITKLKNTAYH